MGFIQSNTSIDLGDTPIENIFIDVYMPMANGTFVKVYLLGYKYAQARGLSMEVNNMTIARQLNIPLTDVLSAWDFWENKQIIKKHKHSEDEADYTVEFINLKQHYIDNNYRPITAFQGEASISSREEKKKSGFACSPSDLVEANKVPEIREMFREINSIMARDLTPNEKLKVLELLYRYHIDPPLITEAFRYTKGEKKARHILSFASGVIRTWYDQGVSTIEELQDHLIKQGEKYGFYSRIFKALGFTSRGPSEGEIKVMDRWIEDFAFDLELILEACQNSSKTANPSINYINGILTDWHKKGIRKVEDIEKLDQKTRHTPKTPIPKNQLAESRRNEYTAEELEQLILNNQRKKLNR